MMVIILLCRTSSYHHPNKQTLRVMLRSGEQPVVPLARLEIEIGRLLLQTYYAKMGPDSESVLQPFRNTFDRKYG